VFNDRLLFFWFSSLLSVSVYCLFGFLAINVGHFLNSIGFFSTIFGWQELDPTTAIPCGVLKQ